MTSIRSLVVLTILALGLSAPALAQDTVSGDIELGADGRASYEGPRGSSDVRIGLSCDSMRSPCSVRWTRRAARRA